MRPTVLTTPVTVEVAELGAVDDYGNPTDTYTTAGVFPGYAWLASADERTTAGELQVQEWRLILDAEADGIIQPASRVIFDGIRYEVIGAPWTARNPRTREVSHIEASLRRSDG